MRPIRKNIAIKQKAAMSKSFSLTAFVFTLTIFLSAGLLFFIQPLFAKLVLPILGGSSSVWTTAMLFFQSILVLGYIYAHLSTKYLPIIGQVALHIVFWLIALTVLPIAAHADWITDPSNVGIAQTLMVFGLGVGLPFAFLSANAPLIQKWYARTDGPSADDPYFLYAASNCGSLIALLAFPLAIEQIFGSRTTSYFWSGGFVVFGLCLLLIGFYAFKGTKESTNSSDFIDETPPTLQTMLYWIFLAAIPSSMMLGVTTKISSDIGSFPLVWIIPLSLYLLSFIYAFSKLPAMSFARQNSIIIASIIVLSYIFTQGGEEATSWNNFAVLIIVFFLIALIAHKRLYEARPSQASLTAYYVIISIGGALGGLFNSVIAPQIFNNVHELPLIVAVIGLLMWQTTKWPSSSEIFKTVLSGVILGFVYFLAIKWIRTSVSPESFAVILRLSMPIGIIGLVFLFRNSAWRSSVIVPIFVLFAYGSYQSPALYSERSFFGIHRVADRHGIREYSNGTTLHGAQIVDDDRETPLPLTYYHPKAPMGQIFSSSLNDNFKSVGVVGLGVGALACYAKDGQEWQFYEIDEAVDVIARDAELFTFMTDCAPDAPTHIGDARLVLSRQTNSFDILVIDAFSSDSIPLHLLTKEAIAMYTNQLSENGLLVMHISNRYYDLSGPLKAIFEDLNLNSATQLFKVNEEDQKFAKSSQVVVVSKSKFAAEIADNPVWQPIDTTYDQVWTDDKANLLSTLR